MLDLKLGLPILLWINLLVSCAPSIPSPETEQAFEKYRRILENATTPTGNQTAFIRTSPAPLFKEVSPLQKRINIAFYQEHYENVIFFLGYEAGLSIIIDPAIKKEIPPDKERMTLQMKNQSIEEVLKKVCEILDVDYRIERGVLKIVPFKEKIFNLGFLPVIKEGKTSVGGDVLGNIGQAGQAGLASAPLKGEFSINAQLSKENLDIYTSLEETLSTLLSEKGIYNFNRLTGVLYVKDKPSRVLAISQLIEEFKRKYRKQIILDAQIIEIELNKGYNLGVDWFEITNFLMGNNRVSFNTLDLGITTRTDQPSIALTISGQPNISLLLNLLREYGELKVISNPKIRVLHSQPALISVGTAQSYIREFKRDITTGTGTSPVVTYTTQTSSVFDGILLGITPFMGEDEEIFLHVVPIKSDLVELRDVRFGDNYFITLPRVNLREMTSIVKARPNDLIVIGGLILDRDKGTEKRLAIPILSEIFRSQQRNSNKAELVILIRLITD